jgi:[acyl-carrier-protein] S-malonyltransferase
MKKFAYLFPGQGAQTVGMGRDFFDTFRAARDCFEEADELLAMHLSRIIFEGPLEHLTETRYSQLAIFVVSSAILRVMGKELPDFKPFVAAGLSLGEYTALFAASRLSFKDALLLIKKRSELMNLSCEETSGAMAAVLGLSGDQVEEALQGLSAVWPANLNCPGQVVISGTQEGIEKATGPLKERGAKRVIPLQVHGAFHSPLMIEAEKGLLPYLEQVSFEESNVQVVMNVLGDFAPDPKGALRHQITRPVRWESGIRAIEKEGVDLYLEIGCGKTLSGMNRKIGTRAETISIEKVSELEGLHATA